MTDHQNASGEGGRSLLGLMDPSALWVSTPCVTSSGSSCTWLYPATAIVNIILLLAGGEPTVGR